MKRVVTPELLDTDSGSPEEVQESLADLRSLIRYFGGVPTTARLLTLVAERTGLSDISYLDVGSARGDASAAAQHSLARRDITVNATLLDRRPSHLPRNGRIWSAKIATV